MMTQQTEYQKLAALSKETFVEAFNLNGAGLSGVVVKERQQEYGLNKIKKAKTIDKAKEWFTILATPLTILLIILALFYFIFNYLLASPAEKDLSGVMIILMFIFLKVAVIIFQTKQSNKLIGEAMNQTENDAVVLRDGHYQKLSSEKIVYGDTIQINAGETVPADVRIISSNNFSVSQMLLTGESKNQIKSSVYIPNDLEDEEIVGLNTLAFKGSYVETGSAEGVVIATGQATLLAHNLKSLNKIEVTNIFDEKMNALSKWILQIALVIAPLVVLVYGMMTGLWYQAIIFGLSVVVIASPEFFPFIISSSLINQMKQLGLEGVRVKNRSIMTNLSTVNTIVVDGADILSKENMSLINVLNPQGESSDIVLTDAYVYAVSDSSLNNCMKQQVVALAKEKIKLDELSYERISEQSLKYGRAVVVDTGNQKRVIIQGEAKEIANQCKWFDVEGEHYKLSKDWLDRFEEYVDELNYDGLRVIGLASKANASQGSEMVFMGYLVFSIPIHQDVATFIEVNQDLDLKMKLITEDSRVTIKSKMRELGYDAVKIITGDKLALLNNAQLKDIVARYHIFAQIDAEQKVRIIHALQENGDSIGYLSEGANDAVSLTRADIGITTAIGTSTAREFADVVIEEENLLDISELIISGRRVFVNIMKYILSIGSYYLGTALAILAASFFLPFVPMEPQQLLVLNLMTSLIFIALLWDDVSFEDVIDTKRWSNSSVKQSIVRFGLMRFICDVLFFVLLNWFILPNVMNGTYQTLDINGQAAFEQHFRTSWFIMSLWTQTYALYILNTSKGNFFGKMPSLQMMFISILGLLVGTVLVYSPFGGYIELIPLSMRFWKWILVFLIGYLVVLLCNKYFSFKDKEKDLK